MKTESQRIEEKRLEHIENIQDYPWFKERHRVFPAIFENRQHQNIIDLSAGVGCAALRIKEQYNAKIICNDICSKCLKILNDLGLPTVSFNLDDTQVPFPFPDDSFDAAISLVTIEHLMHPDYFLKETHRILKADGYFYISTPNYAALESVVKLIISGRTFHDPLVSSEQEYEFFAHVRYFTYRTLLNYVSSFGFEIDTVCIAMPGGSSRFKNLYSRSKLMANSFKTLMKIRHRLLSPRWASEPILCFQKATNSRKRKVRKIVL